MASLTEGSSAGRPLALIERLDREGGVLQCTPVYQWPARIGRAFEADLLLDDPHVAAQHAELNMVDGQVHLSLGPTLNGAMVGARHLQAGEQLALSAGQTWRVGTTHLRVRLPGDPLAPELPLARHQVLSATAPALSPWRAVLPWLLWAVLGMLGQQWLDNDPGTPVSNYLSLTLTMLAVFAVWAMLWALASKLFQGRLAYLVHWRLALRYGLLWMVLTSVLPWLAFMLDATILSRMADAAGLLVLCAMVWSHLMQILPGHRKGLTIAVASLCVSAVGLNIWLNEQRSGRVFNEMYASALLPPAWRLAPMQSPSALIDDARALKPRLDRQAREDEGNDGADAGDAD
jgi:hypothetical protein